MTVSRGRRRGRAARAVVLGIAVTWMAPAAPAVADEQRPGDAVERLEREVEALRAEIEALRRELREGAEKGSEETARRDAADGAGGGDRLAEVERKIDVLADEIERLKIGVSVPGAATAAAAAGETPRAYGLAPAASKVYRAGQGLSIGGYGEMLYESFDDSRDDGRPALGSDRLDFLRAIVYFGYKFDDRFVFNSEIEIEHADEVFVEFAYLDWLYRPELNVRAGLVLLPMGLVNELHEPTTFLGAKRPDVERVILPTTWRENGFGLFGELGPVTYRTYVVNGFDGLGFGPDGLRGGRQKGSKAKADDLAWVGRVDWDALPGLLVGGSAYAGDSGQGFFTDGGRPVSLGTRIYEGHVDWRWRGLRLRGLVARAELDDVARWNRAHDVVGAQTLGERLEGQYLEAGYDLFSRRGGHASLTPYLRWEEFDTQAEVPAGFSSDPRHDVESLTLGLAFQPIDQVIVKVDWQDYDNAAGTGIDQLNVALGYIF